MPFDCVVAGSHLRLDGVWQRPHHILSRFAERVPVLFVEEPFGAQHDADAIERSGNLERLRPLRARAGSEPFDTRTVEATRAWVGARRPLVWLYTPLAAGLAKAFGSAPVVFDRMDDLAAFDLAPSGLRESERSLLARADAVFTGGASLYAAVRDGGGNVYLEPSGVEFDHFAQARSRAPHPLFAGLSRPRCGYAGVLDERIDFALLDALAERGFEVIAIGPTLKIDGRAFPRRPNVHFTGQVPYADLPAYLAGLDVALMPFLHNAATRSISPTKTPEYLAAGLPVVSTRIADVVSAYDGIVYFADDPATFVGAVEAALEGDPTRRERGFDAARARAWDAIFARMWRVVSGE